jgi:uncharacterized protein YjbI with pentapeptide repeats
MSIRSSCTLGVASGLLRKVRGSATLLALAMSAPMLALQPAAAADCQSSPYAKIDWTECNKSLLMLGGSDLSSANLTDADFTSTDLRDANLAGANLEKATLVRASLAGAQADKANFARIEGYRTSFAGISAQGASFASAEMQRADFSQANVTGSDFQKAELGRANFAKATITGTKFPMANLSRAELRGAVFEGPIDFTDAFLFLTRIGGLDLSKATGLQQSQIDLTCGDKATKLPTGLKAPATWPCKLDTDDVP